MKRNPVAPGDSSAPGGWQRRLRATRAPAPLLTAILVTHLLWWREPLVLTRLDLLAYDAMAPMRDSTADTAVVIAIDDRSLAALGRWPWPRATHAKLLDTLLAARVPAVALTIMFAEPDQHDPQGDAVLATAIARHGKVVLPVAPVQRSAVRSFSASPPTGSAVSSQRRGPAAAKPCRRSNFTRAYSRPCATAAW